MDDHGIVRLYNDGYMQSKDERLLPKSNRKQICTPKPNANRDKQVLKNAKKKMQKTGFTVPVSREAHQAGPGRTDTVANFQPPTTGPHGQLRPPISMRKAHGSARLPSPAGSRRSS